MANASADTWPLGSALTGQDTAAPAPAVTPVPGPTATPVPAPTATAVPVPTTAPTPAVHATVAPKTTTIRSSASARVVRQTFAQRVMTEARKHYGARYQWGATGPYRFDCSGFTRYVFRKLHVSLPRTSSEQYRAVRHISRGAKQVGDLIFKYSSGGRIHHVGIYAGSGRMIAATHTGDVVRYQSVRGSYKVGRVR
ncbi:MAG: hypothetical protein JWM93_3162 [Frankiales bacterium]|nr:hypothetical protein [Frankiales bacterium]